MKFLVLALCVCAASAASYNRPTTGFFGSSTPRPWQKSPSPTNYQPQRTSAQYFQTTTAPQTAKPYTRVSPTYATSYAPTTFQPPIVETTQVYRAVPKPYKEPESVAVEPARLYNKPSYKKESEAEVVSQVFEVKPESYFVNYETSNGIGGSATGTLKTVDGVNVFVVGGDYHYQGLDGEPFELTYTADENGYRPESKYLPVGPPTPEYVERLVKYLYEHAPKEETKH